MKTEKETHIALKGVSTNNLKSLDISFPCGNISVVTGCSGSGKSSLVFHSLFAESQRRYLESLSSFSRQYIKAQAKPEIQEAKNLLPAIAIGQARALVNNRSTVGSLTEVNNLLELVFFHLSESTCPSCSKIIKKKSLEEISCDVLKTFSNEDSLIILAPLDRYTGLKASSLISELKNLGYSRLWSKSDGFFRAETSLKKDLSTYCVVVDRLSSEELSSTRILEALGQAFQIAKKKMTILDSKNKETSFSLSRVCHDCDLIIEEPKLSLFSYNSPLGACSTCQGYGQSSHIDWEKALPCNEESLSSKGLTVLDFGSHTSYYDVILKNAKLAKISSKKSFNEYTKQEKNWLKEGDGKKFKGLKGYFDWLESKKYKPHYRMHLSRFKMYKTCSSCQGKRFKKTSLLYQIEGQNISDILRLNHSQLLHWSQGLYTKSKNETREELSSATDELKNRLFYLEQVGLGYLSSDRLSKTLSGGELQRIKMSRCLGNYLTQTLFCLDEPTSGLHPRDTEKLVGIIKRLKDQGNTIVVVEHEKALIKEADHLLIIGPESGERGGQLIYEGPVRKTHEEKNPLEFLQKEKPESVSFLELKKATIHNLKNISVTFPLQKLIGICGVSGSGKTSLIKHTLYPLLREKLYKKKRETALKNEKLILKGKKQGALSEVFFVSQDPITRSSRSTIATYLGIFDEIRKTFGSLEEAKSLGLDSKHFSFNSPGGRCDFCKGKGVVAEELSFLGSVDVTCEKCQGKRYTHDVLSINYKGYSILDILNCTVQQLEPLFPKSSKIKRVVKEVSAVGLGYITLGQELSSFSGGEAQRLKLLSISLSAKSDKKACLIFDEPTSGLSDEDIATLLKHFQSLIEDGHTVIVVEHHTGLLRHCDWLIEIGPEASDAGGDLVFEGTAKELKQHSSSFTAPYL